MTYSLINMNNFPLHNLRNNEKKFNFLAQIKKYKRQTIEMRKWFYFE